MNVPIAYFPSCSLIWHLLSTTISPSHSSYSVAGDPPNRPVRCVADWQGVAVTICTVIVAVRSHTFAAVLIKRMVESLWSADSFVSAVISLTFRVHSSVNWKMVNWLFSVRTSRQTVSTPSTPHPPIFVPLPSSISRIKKWSRNDKCLFF